MQQRKPLLHFHFFTFAKRLARFAHAPCRQPSAAASSGSQSSFVHHFLLKHRPQGLFSAHRFEVRGNKKFSNWFDVIPSGLPKICANHATHPEVVSKSCSSSLNQSTGFEPAGSSKSSGVFSLIFAFFAAGSSSPTSFVVACDSFFFRSTAKRSPTPAAKRSSSTVCGAMASPSGTFLHPAFRPGRYRSAVVASKWGLAAPQWPQNLEVTGIRALQESAWHAFFAGETIFSKSNAAEDLDFGSGMSEVFAQHQNTS